LTSGVGLSCGNAVSADGSVVVGYLADTPRSLIRPFRWTRAEGAAELVSNTEFLNYSNALALSADGDVVAGYASLGSRIGAFRWTQASGITMVGPGEQVGLSGDGATLVGADESWADGDHLYRSTPADGAFDLGLLGRPAGVNALSGDGTTIVGWVGDTPSSSSRAFVWTSREGVVRIGPSSATSRANAVSAGGSVVVGAHTADGGSKDVAFRWDREHGFADLDLGALAIGSVDGSSASGITSDGTTIVGTNAQGSWIWSRSTGARLVSDLLAQEGADIAGFSDFQVTDISDDGTVITGCLKDSTLATEAFVARLGDPACCSGRDLREPGSCVLSSHGGSK
jgi:uncharacterized membrane protein